MGTGVIGACATGARAGVCAGVCAGAAAAVGGAAGGARGAPVAGRLRSVAEPGGPGVGARGLRALKPTRGVCGAARAGVAAGVASGAVSSSSDIAAVSPAPVTEMDGSSVSCEKINRSHTHTDREQHPDNDTYTRTRREQHPK